MSIHAESQQLEQMLYPKGRTPNDGLWYGSGARALEKYPELLVGRPGKTQRDRRGR